jgi:hypothetical protein
MFGLYILSCVGSGVQRLGLALSIGPKWVGFYLRMEMESSLWNILKKKKDDVQKLNNCTKF